MTSAENLDADLEQPADEEFGDDAGQDAQASAPKAAKSGGGGFVKFLLLLVLLGGAGGAGAIKMGLYKPPFDVPGLTPEKTAAAPASPAAPVLAQAEAAMPPSGMEGIAPQSGEAATKMAANAPADAGTNNMMPAALSAPDDGKPKPKIASPGPEDIAPAMPAALPDSAAAPALVAPGDSAAAAPPALSAPAPSVPAPAELSAAPAETKPAPAQTPPALSAPAPEQAAAPETAPTAMATAPAAAPDAATDAKLQKLEQRLTALEEGQASLATKSDIDALKASLGKIQSMKATREAKPAKAAPAVAETPDTTEAPAPVKAAAKTHKAAAHVAAHAAKTAKPSVSRSPTWILKSAKPGAALVAAPGSSEMHQVSVGDTLSGIGKVTAIAQDSDGHWVVAGTKGKINQ